MQLSENARRVLEVRYLRRDAQGKVNETPEQLFARVATTQLNLRAKPWVWGRPPKIPRCHRRLFCYRF